MKKNNFGFTLVELLVVIGIIAVLVTIVVVAVNPVRLIQNSRDTKRRSDLNQIKAAMQLYYNENKNYPTTATNIPFGSVWTVSGTTYMKQVPNDTDGSYSYTGFGTCGTSCTDYYITAFLYNPSSDDTNTLTKCGVSSSSTVKFAVCND